MQTMSAGESLARLSNNLNAAAANAEAFSDESVETLAEAVNRAHDAIISNDDGVVGVNATRDTGATAQGSVEASAPDSAQVSPVPTEIHDQAHVNSVSEYLPSKDVHSIHL